MADERDRRDEQDEEIRWEDAPTREEDSQDEGDGGDEDADASSKAREGEHPAAPSIGPDTKIEHIPPEERLAGHEHSSVDAMGLDKRRAVVGQTYGPTLARQAALYGIFIAFVAALVIGGKLLADELDQPPADNPAKAPWAAEGARQIPPDRLQ